MNKALIAEAVRLDDIIWEEYSLKEGDTPIPGDDNVPQDERALLWLEADLGTIATNVSKEEFDGIIKRYIETSPCANEIKKAINLTGIAQLAAIKKNWKDALSIVENGRELSGYIDYGLTSRDLAILAKLHRDEDNGLKEKIENLLGDCNFHSENSDLSEGKYDKYLKYLPDSYEEDSDLQFLEINANIHNLMDKLKITRGEAKELLDNSWDDRDNEWSVVYDSVEEFGHTEFDAIVSEGWIANYFDFQSFGEDLVGSGDRPVYVLSSGKVAVR